MVVEAARAALSFFAFLAAEEVKRERRKVILRLWGGAKGGERGLMRRMWSWNCWRESSEEVGERCGGDGGG